MPERVKDRATFNPFASHELYHMTLELFPYQRLHVLRKETREWKYPMTGSYYWRVKGFTPSGKTLVRPNLLTP